MSTQIVCIAHGFMNCATCFPGPDFVVFAPSIPRQLVNDHNAKREVSNFDLLAKLEGIENKLDVVIRALQGDK